jgi:hypothetical protein
MHADQDKEDGKNELNQHGDNSRLPEDSALLEKFDKFVLNWKREMDEANRVPDSNTIGAHAHDSAMITSRQQEEEEELEDAPSLKCGRGDQFTNKQLVDHLRKSYAACFCKGF